MSEDNEAVDVVDSKVEMLSSFVNHIHVDLSDCKDKVSDFIMQSNKNWDYVSNDMNSVENRLKEIEDKLERALDINSTLMYFLQLYVREGREKAEEYIACAKICNEDLERAMKYHKAKK